MTIKTVPLSKLKPAPYNPRKDLRPGDPEYEAIKRSLKEFGLVEPLVVNKRSGFVVGGHQRLKALADLGETEAPVVEVDLDTNQEQALNMALNKIEGKWDMPKLKDLLIELDTGKFDITLTGFSEYELKNLIDYEGQQGKTDPDDIPSPPEKAITKPGDLWLLGDHRLLCGDSSNPDHIDTLLGGGQVHLVNTDPPYNVKVEPRSNNAIHAGQSSFKGNAKNAKLDLARHPGKSKPTGKMRARDRALENDWTGDEAFDHLLDLWFANISRVLLPGRSFYIWAGYRNVFNYPRAIVHAKLYFAQIILWVKGHPVLTRKDFMGDHESCYYGWMPGRAHYFNPSIKNATDVWEVKKVTPQKMVHLTEKPVELAELAMTYSSRKGEGVLDLFGGSGSTLIAAERTGRKSYLMELDTLYCDVIVNRYEAFTGNKAKRG